MALPPSKRKTISNFILLTLEKSVDGYVRFEDFTYHHYRYKYGIKELKKSSLSQTLNRLRKNGVVELLSNQELAYRLTEVGKEQVMWEKLKTEDQIWDGKWRIVIFDIPEKRRIARDLLRFRLKQLGFTRWQKSVWASKLNCTEILRNFIRKVGIEDWVLVLESENIGR